LGDPAVIGTVGINTDIQDNNNKCSWWIVQASQRSTVEQKQLLKDNYGHRGNAKGNVVKQVYRSLDLPAVFEAFEEESYIKVYTSELGALHGPSTSRL
jgi:farnesyl diphosphate synthase